MSDKYIKEFSEATTPNSTDALLIDQGLGAYKYCQIANLLKGVNVSGMGTLGCGAITSSGKIETTSTAVDSIKTAGGVSVAGDIAKTSTVTDTSITASSTQVFVDNRAITARHYEEWTIVTSASNTLRSIHKAYVYRRDSTTVSGYVVEILDTYGTQDCTFTNNGDGTFDLSFVNGQAFSVNLSASMIIRSQG